MKYIILKVDTTGLSPDNADIVHISALRVDGEDRTVFDQYINPGYHIPIAASNISGVFDKDVAGKPKFEDVKDSFFEFIGDLPIIGHNISFDLGFINKNLETPLKNKSMSLMDMARSYGYNGSLKFMAMCNHYGIPCSLDYSITELTDMLFDRMIKDYKQRKDNKDA